MAQIHALLFFHGKPMHAKGICETLSLARSNASNSQELLGWKLIRSTQVLGDRRQYFETSAEVWDLFRAIIKGRKEREFDPTVALLRELTEASEFADESSEAQKRVKDTLNPMLRNEQGKLMFTDIHAGDFIPPTGYSQKTLLERIHAKQAVEIELDFYMAAHNT
ncbi:hypothetical protein AXE65_07775 [Ventosimonas gracilis]|uniref:Transcriptional regulator n=1 Tax=Ventosimonas gracilis TaxID=1680762 RepID=A0A139SHV0_9GAMM|nr:hypothetical protein [Ventosimonas gracilis]KXU34101.1 hypothetical protein AXE65_07775 [Ventosimonas gracilis]